MLKIKQYYHIVVQRGICEHVLNIEDISSYNSTLFGPFINNARTVFVHGKEISKVLVRAVNVYSTNKRINSKEELVTLIHNLDGGDPQSNACLRDITDQVLSDAKGDSASISSVPFQNRAVFRVMALGIVLLTVVSSLTISNITDVIGKVRFAVSAFVCINTLPIVIVGKWEWGVFEKIILVISFMLSIVSAFVN